MLRNDMHTSFYIAFLYLLLACSGSTYGQNADTAGINRLLQNSFERIQLDQDSALQLASQAYSLAKAGNFSKGIGSASMRIGSILSNKGLNDSALFYFRQARQIRLNLNDYNGAIGACVMMNYSFDALGQKDSALSVLYQALHLMEHSKDSIRLINIYINLGKQLLDIGESSRSLFYYEQAKRVAEQFGDDASQASTNSGLGYYYSEKHRFDLALPLFLKALNYYRQSGDLINLTQVQGNIALCYEKLDQPDKALVLYHDLLEVEAQLNMHFEMTVTNYNIGKLLFGKKQTDQAIVYFEKALGMATEMHDLDYMKSCYAFLAECYAAKKNFAKAYDYHIKYSNASDTLINNERVKQMAEMQTKYETGKIEQNNTLLKEQNKRKSAQRNFFIAGTLLSILLACAVFIGLLKTRKEKRKSEDLLLNILPSEVADELKRTGSAVARQYNDVTVMFTDFVNFTGISEKMSATELVEEINRNFTAFDTIIEKHGLEKIKTVGDAYLAVCGLPQETSDHAERVVRAAKEIMAYMKNHEGKFQLRIGIHSGPVVAGIVGVKKFAYDIWGDTVNTASRMESTGEAGKINISEATYALIKSSFVCIHRGKVEAKNKGMIDMYFVE